VSFEIGDVHGNVNSVGPNATFHGPVDFSSDSHRAAPASPAPRPSRAEVGVLTVIDPEIHAVVAVLRQMYDYRERRLRHGPTAYEAWLPDRWGRRVRVAAVRSLRPGNESAVLAYQGLVEEYNPATVLLVGVAGGIGDKVAIGDVVIGDQVIMYDHRRVTAEGPRHRGQAQEIAPDLLHRLAEFAVAVPGQHRSFRVHHGPIGSGNAVVTDAGSEIRLWLNEFHERVLAVETESAGLAQAFHERVRGDGVRGWLPVRGISDRADAAKGHAYHQLAAGHAAVVMAMLLPYLYFEQPDR
jgi:adenosylhomocysteine nucleosidase